MQATPLMVGTRRWTMISQSIRTLLAEHNSTYLVLNFYRNQEILPNFGLTTFPVKELFWELAAQDNKSAKLSEYVLVHQWDNEDKNYWERLTFSNGDSVVIYLEYDPSEQAKIKVILQHNGILSSTYKFQMGTIQQDAYMIFFSPLSKYRKMKDDVHNPLSLLSIHGFLEEFGERIKQGYSNSRAKKEYSECRVCYTNKADIVSIPCGHLVFCWECVEAYQGSDCPICKTQLGNTELFHCKSRIASDSCLVCPARFNCTKMDCMLYPCGCIIGCFKYTERAIKRGDQCPHCRKEVDKLQKVYPEWKDERRE